ncbi:MAG: deoxyribodipyrimidine photo-lyase, partial [Acidimicrobiia bacterium]|nr:deoxyribodipyrimidine photo-lyase [Acidimicrobiia bacterium]
MTNIDPRPGVVWFRRDLRLEDNPAWAAATSAHAEVIGLFILEPALLETAGQMRRDQLLAHIDALDCQLQALGGGLVMRFGPAATAIPVAV